MGVPVVVTQHLVGPVAPSWESEPDALIATTSRGAAMVEARQPGKRVDHIPLGCPTWFPPRKPCRGRVIGAFGFLERHKGFWQLLNVVDRVRDAELVIYSHAKRPEIAAAWESAAAGRRVRRIAEFLPVHEVAQRLAAEADILVFWYEETGTAQASLAARVGLATGVPVLTSPTSWFEDLGEAVYQPADLIEGSCQLLEDDHLRERVGAAAQGHCQRQSWPSIAKRHSELWHSLER
jgi:glycosyltransferase involved in cell wall biosynthesis